MSNAQKIQLIIPKINQCSNSLLYYVYMIEKQELTTLLKNREGLEGQNQEGIVTEL